MTRWGRNGALDKIERVKYVMKEPNVSAKLNETMEDYRKKIADCAANSDRSSGGINGAILFAVFRGKVAEGIDFSDNEARCVITIGIPYAVKRDPQVELKMAYNDLHSREKKLMRGHEWYKVQAYRALNQALGRCIRHRDDWGVILLIDERLVLPDAQNYLPNWVKLLCQQNTSQYNLRAELKSFVNKRLNVQATKISDVN